MEIYLASDFLYRISPYLDSFVVTIVSIFTYNISTHEE